MEQSIENEITYYRSLLKLKTLIQYEKNSKKDNTEFNRIMMNTLGLYAQNGREKKSFPEIELIL